MMNTQLRKLTQLKLYTHQPARTTLAAFSLMSLLTGCSSALAQSNQPGASAEPVILPTLMPTPTPVVARASAVPASMPTPWPTPTLLPTPTPWPAPVAWRPTIAPLPTLAPMPIAPAAAVVSPGGSLPVSYSPPDGVDVFGGTLLRWTFGGLLAEDEFFDIRIKPNGSNDSVFVDWSKTPEYTLHPWSGWQPGLYTWQIGIIKGYMEGETKHFIADTGRDSQPFLIKWQAGGGGGGGGGNAAGGGGNNSTGGGGGGQSGGS